MVPVMLKIASQNANIYEYLLLTYAVSLPTSLAFVLLRGKAKRLVDSMRNLKEFAFIAFLGILNYGMLEYGLTYSEKFLSASLATVVYRTSPLLMLIFLPIMLRERVSKLQIAALMLGFAGLYIAITGGSLTALGGIDVPIIGLVALIALSCAFVSVALKRYSFDMEIAMFIFSLATFAFFAVLFIAAGAPLARLNASAVLAILYVGIVYNVFVGLMYYGALRMSKTTFVTNVYFLSPFITFLFSWIILGEQIYLYYIAIAALVSVGLIIQKFDSKGGTYMQGKAASRTMHDVTGAFVGTNVPLIYNAIRSGGRVLAMKLDSDAYGSIGIKRKNTVVDGKAVFICPCSDRRMISKEQSEFVNDVLGVKDGEHVIIGAGDPEANERALSDLIDGVGGGKKQESI